MYIRKRFISAGYKILVSLSAIAAASMLFVVYGISAWRLFSTWSMLLIAVYFFLAGVVVVFAKKRESGKVPCVMLQGMCITASATLVLMECLSFAGVFTVPGVGGLGVALINFIVPVFVLFDWILFSKKGLWHTIDPWYWLAWIICYFTVMTLTANYLPKSTLLLYPYEFLNYPEIGLDRMAWWIAIFMLLELAFGYLMFCLDLLIGGKLSKYIVLPKIKTIVIEEEVPQDSPESDGKVTSEVVREVVKSPASQLVSVENDKNNTPVKSRVSTKKPNPTRNRTSAKGHTSTKKRVLIKDSVPAESPTLVENSTPTKNPAPIIRKEALRQKAKTEQARKVVAVQSADEKPEKESEEKKERDGLVSEETVVREVKEVVMGRDPIENDKEDKASDEKSNNEESSPNKPESL